MREIKYKFWLDVCNVIGTVESINFRFGKVVVMWKADDGFRTCTYDLLEGKLIQYTGLKDKNGNGIYEGDIMKTDSGANQYVTYRNDMAMFVCRFKIGASTNISSTWEVIGNIYENPELIQQL